ncbi:MAG: exo-alpha-sialidase [Chloroflexi bacterium]|nr:exo-alpha-sialidase [Chloroflexota bacterium]
MTTQIAWRHSDSVQVEDLWISGTGAYHTYRIPAPVITSKGTLLAFCEGRKPSHHDVGEIDLLLRRSVDGGRTWSDTQVVATDPGMTCGNPAPVVDGTMDTIWLPFCRNPAFDAAQRANKWRYDRPVWLTRSDDDGVTWAKPVEITGQVKRPSWTWYSTGPVHGIQLRSGRLLVSYTHRVRREDNRDASRYAHVIYSDDHGATWAVGGSVPQEGTNECVAVEMVDGTIFLNCRDQGGRGRRCVAWSRDGGLTFADYGWDEALIEPPAQATAIRLTTARAHDRNRVLFCNPASRTRDRLTVRLSYDEGRTWPVQRVLETGASAYSDLAVTDDLSVFCLFERGVTSPYERLTLARFGLNWLEDGDARRARHPAPRLRPAPHGIL